MEQWQRSEFILKPETDEGNSASTKEVEIEAQESDAVSKAEQVIW